MKKLLIVGAGGFGRELYVWASQHPDCDRAWTLAGFLDDNADALAAFGSFAPVHTLAGHKPSADTVYLAGLGMPPLKEKLVAPLVTAGAEFLTFVHPSALIGARITLGRGVVVCPGAILSVDIDVVDPGMAPGTGTPEPGGLTSRELLEAVRRICLELPIVGIDVVEVAPAYDSSEITAFLANRVVLEALSAIAKRRNGTPYSASKNLLEGR